MSDPTVLISEADVQRRVGELAAEISRDYDGMGEITLIAVLKGAFIFLADLSRRLAVPRRIEFMALSSYEDGSTHSGAVRLVMDLRESIEGRHVLVVEDIVDTGRTLHYLIELLRTREPASVRTCALVRKKDRHEVEVAIDYLGFDIPDVWVVGYGLDYDEQHRALPYIGVVEPEGA
ncbi:MAG: hypoxanthine phosphoribosyltransferase [Gemmatimonadota bacterium]|nr:MAG: hypoxanthine phosphoribosyltransferase [Gemmatimonadota bacterium]